jgi:hypothetical protein
VCSDSSILRINLHVCSCRPTQTIFALFLSCKETVRFLCWEKEGRIKGCTSCMHDLYPAGISLYVSHCVAPPVMAPVLGRTGFACIAGLSCLSTAAHSQPSPLPASNSRPAGPGQLDEGSRDVGIYLLGYNFLIDFNYIFPTTSKKREKMMQPIFFHPLIPSLAARSYSGNCHAHEQGN